jgi:hypothetical protein
MQRKEIAPFRGAVDKAGSGRPERGERYAEREGHYGRMHRAGKHEIGSRDNVDQPANGHRSIDNWSYDVDALSAKFAHLALVIDDGVVEVRDEKSGARAWRLRAVDQGEQ